MLVKIKNINTKTSIGKAYPKKITKRFWLQLLNKREISKEINWSEISKNQLNRILNNLFRCKLEVLGKSRFKEKFVE